jgi:L-ectoine synthase
MTMKVINVMELHKTEREVDCPKGGFTSIRILTKDDGMGFTMTRTTVHPTDDFQLWHYKNHLEACYCIKGHGILKDSRGKEHQIKPGICYALDKHDKHYFKAKETTILICVFNPPLSGKEVHQADGSYAAPECGT